MNHIFRLCLPLALGAMALGQISTASAADNNKTKGGGGRGAVHAAAPAHVASAPRAAASRSMAAPRVAARSFSASRQNVATRRAPVTNRSFATRSVNRGTSVSRTAALSRNRSTVNNTAITRSNTARLNNARLTNRVSTGLSGRRQTAMLNTNNQNRLRTGRTAAAGNAPVNRGLVNAGSPRRSLASNQFAFRSGNFQPGWNPGRTYFWQGRHWGCYGGIWCAIGIGWPYDWYAYPYPFYYDGLVYYDGDAYQPGGIPVSDNTVAGVQSTLDNNGYNAGPADGIDGPQTQNAIAQYQSDNGLQPTGVIDEPLLQTMGLQ